MLFLTEMDGVKYRGIFIKLMALCRWSYQGNVEADLRMCSKMNFGHLLGSIIRISIHFDRARVIRRDSIDSMLSSPLTAWGFDERLVLRIHFPTLFWVDSRSEMVLQL